MQLNQIAQQGEPDMAKQRRTGDHRYALFQPVTLRISSLCSYLVVGERKQIHETFL
jgi:hypothetical protein